MSDGLALRVNVFRPAAPGQYPVVMSHGVYGKDVHFNHAFKPQWDKLKQIYPEIDQGESTGRFLRWEVPDPERWVPDGYVHRGGRHARQRQVAGLSRPAPAAREPGLLRADRMGRRAAVVERQGRAARHLLSRHQPVEGRRAAAAAPRRDLSVGGPLGPLPRLPAITAASSATPSPPPGGRGRCCRTSTAAARRTTTTPTPASARPGRR